MKLVFLGCKIQDFLSDDSSGYLVDNALLFTGASTADREIDDRNVGITDGGRMALDYLDRFHCTGIAGLLDDFDMAEAIEMLDDDEARDLRYFPKKAA